jgi:MinD-like ATPase involved in chromosome partitioning or flagellar assembly
MQHFVIGRELVHKMTQDRPFFRSPYPDYYAGNALLLIADRVLVCPYPLVAIGISPKSFGFYYFNQRESEGVEFLRNVEWGELDYLIIDLPPGTGDVALSLIQTAPLSGAVVVTTPSDVSLEDARKAINMFAQVRVPILGMIENMSYLIAPGSGERIDVFGHGGGKRTAEAMKVAFLGELALQPEVRIGGDTGHPVATRDGDDPHAAPFLELARKIEARCVEEQTAGPKITVED